MKAKLRLLPSFLVACLSLTTAAAQTYTCTFPYGMPRITAEEAFERHHDRVIRYYACNQDYAQPIHPDQLGTLRWEATWDGNGFRHTPGPGAEGAAHFDNVLRYVTWDGKCWEASWDPNTDQFNHRRVATGATHQDKVLNYLTWDRTKWSATRDGNEFFHIYIAGAENEVPWEKNVFTFLSNAGRWITVVVAALPK